MDWQLVRDAIPLIWEGVSTTVALFAWSMVYGTILAAVLAILRLSPVAVFRWFSAGFGWLFRGIPLLIMLFYAFFALPELGVLLSARAAAILALSIWVAAYQAEAIRSGLSAVDPGQSEAADALGMSRSYSMRRVIFPQGVRIMIPPYMGNAITLFKQTALASVITVPEMTAAARQLISSRFKAVEPLLTLALFYLAITTVLVIAQQYMERSTRLRT